MPFKSPFNCAYSNTIASSGVLPVLSPIPNNDVLIPEQPYNHAVVELTTAIADEAKAREEADTTLSNRIKAYEDVKDTYATVSALEEVEAIADAARTEAEVNAQIDAKITALDLANTYDAKGAAADAEDNAKAYTDEKIGDLHTVATTGKLGDLENEGRATTAEADYVIFYCGTASILTNPEVTE